MQLVYSGDHTGTKEVGHEVSILAREMSVVR